MATTKRTTANSAFNIAGGRIRLLKTKLTANKGSNALMYKEVRRAVANNDTTVLTNVQYPGNTPYTAEREFGPISKGTAEYEFEMNGLEDQYDPNETYFTIGCHVFTLKMFNRILRAAGIRTTKPQTLKAFKAVA